MLLDHPDLIVHRITQECGVIRASDGELDPTVFPLGAVVRIVPNHACMTASGHRQYYIVNEKRDVIDVWRPCHGW